MPDDQNALTVCPICKVVDTAPEFPQPRGPAKRYPLSRCTRCGLVFLKYAAAETDAGIAGSESPIGPQNRFGRRIERLIAVSNVTRARGRASHAGRRPHARHRLRPRSVDYGQMQPGRYPDASFE